MHRMTTFETGIVNFAPGCLQVGDSVYYREVLGRLAMTVHYTGVPY